MNTDPDSFSRRVISYLLWCIPVSVVFFTVYPLMNAYTAGRDSLYSLWFPAELHIPFVPGFIWVYCSFYLIILMPVLFLPRREHRQLALTFMVMTLLGGVIFFCFRHSSVLSARYRNRRCTGRCTRHCLRWIIRIIWCRPCMWPGRARRCWPLSAIPDAG